MLGGSLFPPRIVPAVVLGVPPSLTIGVDREAASDVWYKLGGSESSVNFGPRIARL